MAYQRKKYAAIALCALATLVGAGMTAHAADDASMPNVVTAIRENENLLGMVRGMLKMTENELAKARGKAGAPVKDLEEERAAHLRMIENLTRELTRLRAIVSAWNEAFEANMKLGIKQGELEETRTRMANWDRPKNPW
jgi:hypothetical protein